MKNKILNVILSSIVTLSILIVIIVEFVKNSKSGYFESDGYGVSIYLNEEYLFIFYGSISLTISTIIDLVYYKNNNETNKLSLNIGSTLAVLFPFSYYAKCFFKDLNKGNGFNQSYFIVSTILLVLSIYFAYNTILTLIKKKDNTK